MTFTRRTLHNSTIVAAMLTIAFASQAAAGEPVVVHVAGGRQCTAEVDSRTDGERLWLVFRTRSAELLRPVAWEHIVSVEQNGKSQSGPEFREAYLSSPGSTAQSDDQGYHAHEVVLKQVPTAQGKTGRTSAEEALDLLFSSATSP